MELTSLSDDLLKEFRAEKEMITEQVELLDPLGTSLRQPAAQRLVNKTLLFLCEIFCYLLCIGGIVFIALMQTIYPFKVVPQIQNNKEIIAILGSNDFNWFVVALYGIAGLCTLFIFVIGRMAHTIRLKNNILNVAGKSIKIMVGQHLERKAAIETLVQRHYIDFSGVTVSDKTKTDRVNDIQNPGYGD